MLSGFYTAASGILAKQREIDIISSNLTNINTTGYRGEDVVTTSFEQALLTKTDGTSSETLIDSMQTTAVVDEVVSNFKTGLIDETGRFLDMAINGEGFFNVIDAEGNVNLTRNGSFLLDAEGYLVIPDVGRVQGLGGDILIGDVNDFRVQDNGFIYKNSTNELLGMLAISAPNEDTVLDRLENGMFTVAQGAVAQSEDFNVVQGALELSNVDMNAELTRLIDVQRTFQTCSSALSILDDMNSRAVTKLGSLT